ncbi:MAG TPA: sigma-70 family RNA polymerase sigma factor [Steroidobacteraceae bacterium]|nr:sigma-70 family RNA polymerase sigma factor [Steroidobacteraceae bacterium]
MDAAIIESLKAGQSQAAFEAVVAGYRRRVFGLAYSIVRDRATAEDVAQEVFVKLWKALDGYDGRAKLSTWIYAIARNTAVSELRKRRASGSLSNPSVLAEAEAASAVDDSIGADDATLWRAVATLPALQRQVVTLYYQDERPVDEVAAMLGLPVNTVKTHLHRARARLATELGAAGEDAA